MSSSSHSRAAYALALVSFFATAQSAPEREQEAVVVTASRVEQRIRDAIPHTTVLTQRDIRDSQAIDLPSLLRREAGFEYTQNGGLGSTTGLFMRGGRSAHALILVDGVRLQDAAFAQTAIQHMMLDQVERIEIVRGNVSALYGSNAVGGVVQIFTKRGQGEPAPAAEAMAGSRDTWKLSGSIGGQAGDTRFNVGASRLETRGFSAIDPRLAPNANPDDDGYRNEGVTANVSQRLSAAHEIGLVMFRTRGRLDYDSAFGAPTDTHKSAQDLGMVQGFWDARLYEGWKSRLSLAETTDERTDTRNELFNNSSNTRNQQVIWDNQFRLAPSHEVSVGIEGMWQTIQNSGLTPPRAERDVAIGRLGYLGRVGDHSFQLNARAEDYSDFGSATTYYAGYGYDLTQAWRVTLSSSTAFRAPTFLDLYGFGGNPNLDPERARSNEVGLQWAEGRHLLRVVAFDTQFQDAITFDPQTFTVRNVRKASVTGVETSYSGRVLGFDVRVALTLQDAVEQEPGGQEQPAIRRADAYGSLSAYRSFGKLRLGGEVISSGARPDTNIQTFARIQDAAYTVVNLTARYDVTKHVYVGLRLDNVFDEDYALVHGFNTAGPGAFLTVGWQP